MFLFCLLGYLCNTQAREKEGWQGCGFSSRVFLERIIDQGKIGRRAWVRGLSAVLGGGLGLENAEGKGIKGNQVD